MELLTIAVPTGRLGKDVLALFRKNNIGTEIKINSRKLDVYDSNNNFRFMFIKPSDVITYVNNGVADIGIVGKDNILEEDKEVYELLDLKLGQCQFVVAGYKGTEVFGKEEPLKVATKYPNFTKKYFNKNNQEIEIIKLNGSVEIAPLVNLSDVIVDITQTGETLKENGLEVLKTIEDISARLIANKVSYRFKNKIIAKLVDDIKE